jgi:hypothetical protein
MEPVEQNVYGRRERMQLNGSAESTGTEAHCVPFRPPPGAPFENDQ